MNKRIIRHTSLAASISLALPVLVAQAAEVKMSAAAERVAEQHYSPYANQDYPTRVLWGDQHIHTGWSADAGAGGATLSPEDALRFARGEQVTSSLGEPVKLSAPLDWAVITDHSDGMGLIAELRAKNPVLMADPTLKKWEEQISSGQSLQTVKEMIYAQATNSMPAPAMDPKLAMTVWQKNTTIAEQFNEPGRFTSLIGYEWTSNAGGGNNLHRNVIYRDDKAKADVMVPMTTTDSENPEELWKWMATWEAKTGGKMLAIPHNPNMSNGKMYQLSTFDGSPPTREWAETRARWEPVMEVTQMKGDSETHPTLSPNDEFANFERWDTANLTGTANPPDMIPFEYARRALQNGLKLNQQLGANPFKFGMLGGTDAHTGLTTADEDNFFGKLTHVEPQPDRWSNTVMGGPVPVRASQMSASGYTGVWAKENTRESIWDAMKRKEVYGTSGPRITVRFFGGWDFTKADAQTRELAEPGYAKGVPMGSDLPTSPKGKAPSFLVAALKDPRSGNLDRYQIIKGWVDGKGQVQEKIYDVAWSGDRKPGKDGKVPPVGNTVDVANATWTDTIGAANLYGYWQDPDFDPALPAFYYGRVIQIPTPRWTAYDAKRFGVKMDDKVAMVLQDRAYTSPIWYTP